MYYNHAWHDMTQFYNYNSVVAVATIFTLATLVASSMTANAAAAATTTTTTTQQPPITTTTAKEATSNNVTNAVLGSLFSFGEGIESSVNAINETYSVISYLGNRVIMPPNTTDVIINATERGDFTLNIQPNGLYIELGQAFIVTEDDGVTAGEEEEENATLTFVSFGTTNPNGTGSRTGVAFYNTNSTGQLAFLDNMVGIFQTKFSPEGSHFREWEWKGGTIPFETKTN
jgi:hypothetical protein